MTSFDISTVNPRLVEFIVFLLGLVFGSFGNVIILRVPKGESIIRPRSHCPKCGTSIAWFDNIPLLSFILLKAKCRKCKTPISFRYPLIEFLSGLLFLILYLKVGPTWTFIEVVIFGWAGLVASVIDIDHRILPDVITLPGIALGLLGSLVNPERHFLDALIGTLVGGGFLWLVAFVYSAVRNEEGMGGGDIKLIGWIGAVLGWKSIIFSILVASITGSLFGLGVAALKKTGLRTAIPFGPFLYFAAILFVFIGPEVMKGYLSIFFPFVD